MYGRLAGQLADSDLLRITAAKPGYTSMQVGAVFTKMLLRAAGDELYAMRQEYGCDQLSQEEENLMNMWRLQSPRAKLEKQLAERSRKLLRQLRQSGQDNPALMQELQRDIAIDKTVTDSAYLAVLGKFDGFFLQTWNVVESICREQSRAVLDSARHQFVDEETSCLARYYTLEELQRMTELLEQTYGISQNNTELFQDLASYISSLMSTFGNTPGFEAEFDAELRRLTPLETAKFAEARGRNKIPFCNPVVVTGGVKWMGGAYEGELLAGRPHGVGTLTLPKGETMYGFWEYGQRHGLILHTKKKKTVAEVWRRDQLRTDAVITPSEQEGSTPIARYTNVYGEEETYGITPDMRYSGLWSQGTLHQGTQVLTGTFYGGTLVYGLVVVGNESLTVEQQPVYFTDGDVTGELWGDFSTKTGYVKLWKGKDLILDGYWHQGDFLQGRMYNPETREYLEGNFENEENAEIQ